MEIEWYNPDYQQRSSVAREFGKKFNLIWITPTFSGWDIEVWNGQIGLGWSEKTPFTGTLEEAKAVGLALYRMQD